MRHGMVMAASAVVLTAAGAWGLFVGGGADLPNLPELAIGNREDRSSGEAAVMAPAVMDAEAMERQLAADGGRIATVYVFLSVHCPISNASLPEVNRLCESFAPVGVQFVGVVPGPSATREEVASHHREYGLRFPVVWDRENRLSRRWGATHTPQAVVVADGGEIVYSGRIDNRYADLGQKRLAVTRSDLRIALSGVVTGMGIPVRRTEPVGCLIETIAASERDADSTGEVTFCRDVAPILFARCARCHRPGEAAPFPLLTYEDARAHAEQIRLVVQRRLMPPWKAEPGYGHFENDRRLSERELETITAWVDGGTPRGKPSELPPPPSFAAGWQLGEPDLELILPEPFEVPAAGPDIYQHFVIPTGLTEGRLVSAMEFRPGAPEVVHHAIVYLDTTGEGRRLDAADPAPGYGGRFSPGFPTQGSLGGWAPGGLPRRLPIDTGRPIWAGSDLVVQIHYHPVGKPVQDRSRIGLHFAPETATRYVADIMVANVNLEIPAGAKRHRHRASYTLPVDTTLLDATPHMHVLGSEIRATAHLPDGSTRPLIWIKDWDFYWQDHYVFAEPVRLPAGTRIELECWYDNSADNPLNPNSPPRTVTWGDFSTDEMGVCYFQATADTERDFLTLLQHAQAYFSRQWEETKRQRQSRRQSRADGDSVRRDFPQDAETVGRAAVGR